MPGAVIEYDVDVPMGDGVVPQADAYRPMGDGRWPAIVTQTPYNGLVCIELSQVDPWIAVRLALADLIWLDPTEAIAESLYENSRSRSTLHCHLDEWSTRVYLAGRSDAALKPTGDPHG